MWPLLFVKFFLEQDILDISAFFIAEVVLYRKTYFFVGIMRANIPTELLYFQISDLVPAIARFDATSLLLFLTRTPDPVLPGAKSKDPDRIHATAGTVVGLFLIDTAVSGRFTAQGDALNLYRRRLLADNDEPSHHIT